MPRIDRLAGLAQRVQTSNDNIVSSISKLQTTAPPVELRFTWSQEPVKFEDALGRILPVPSEYDLEVSVFSATHNPL